MKLPLVFATYFIFFLTFAGCNAALEDQRTLGSHTLTIVETSGKPFGGTSRTNQDAAGINTYFFESANGRYKITLENEVMTVNGKKYTLEKPSDSIRIVDNRVEINGVETAPDTE